MKAELLASARALMAPGEEVTVAVSGGADSVALLHGLWSLQEPLGITLRAAHFNHGLRGEESHRDEAFVRALCQALSVPLAVGRPPEPLKDTSEETARRARYAFFDTLPAGPIATAHTADDNAETVLLHLLRGSGVRGLCGIPPRRGRFIRPLLFATRPRILDYLAHCGLSFVEDSTNASDFALRNRLRHQVLPLLRQECPRLPEKLTAQSALLRSEDAYLDTLAAPLAQADPQGNLPLPPLRAAPEVLQRRALRQYLHRWLPQDVSLPHIEALLRLIHSPSPSARLSLPGLTLSRNYDTLQVCPAPAPVPVPEPALLVLGGTVALGPWRITARLSQPGEIFPNTPFHFPIKYDMIAQTPVLLRPRRTGDVLALPGGHRSLKKLMIDRRIPAAQRDSLPVFDCGGAILAVAGIGAACTSLPSAGQPAWIIHIEKEENPHVP